MQDQGRALQGYAAVAQVYHTQGMLLDTQRHHVTAIETWRKRIAALEKMLTAGSENAGVQLGIADAYFRVGKNQLLLAKQSSPTQQVRLQSEGQQAIAHTKELLSKLDQQKLPPGYVAGKAELERQMAEVNSQSFP